MYLCLVVQKKILSEFRRLRLTKANSVENTEKRTILLILVTIKVVNYISDSQVTGT